MDRQVISKFRFIFFDYFKLAKVSSVAQNFKNVCFKKSILKLNLQYTQTTKKQKKNTHDTNIRTCIYTEVPKQYFAIYTPE